MSNVFRRPMFRGGPTNMNGIMSGIQDRKNYADGPQDPNIKSLITKAKELEPAMQEMMGPYEKPSGFENPIYQLAIQTGLDLMSKADGQNLLRNIGAAAGRQTPQFFENLAKERAAKKEYDRGIKSGAIGLAGDILGKEISAAGKTGFDQELYKATVGTEIEKGVPPMTAKRIADYKMTEKYKELKSKVGDNRIGGEDQDGLLDININNFNQVKTLSDKQKKAIDGKYFYDPYEDNYKYIRIINGVPSQQTFNSIEEITVMNTGADTDKKQKEEIDPTLFGMDIEDPIA